MNFNIRRVFSEITDGEATIILDETESRELWGKLGAMLEQATPDGEPESAAKGG